MILRFQSSVAIKVQSFGQKKMLLGILKMVLTGLEEIDQKLINMEALSPSEDTRYSTAHAINRYSVQHCTRY